MPTLSDRFGSGAKKVLHKVAPPRGMEAPSDVVSRVKRGREALAEVSARRREAIEFARNNHYVSIDKTGRKLKQQSTVAMSEGGDKLNHRVRRSHDILAPILKGKVSAATSRVPTYEVLPTTYDHEDYSASRVAKKVLDAGYELWSVQAAFRRGVHNALVTEEAFFMPYWDPDVGPFVEAPPEIEGEPPMVAGMGEIKIGVYSGLEVTWEPGVQFEDSRWYAIDHARPIDQLERDPDFIGGKLSADAELNSPAGQRKPKGSNLAMVTEYFERPCRDWPSGRRLTISNGREIFPEEEYPLRDHNGQVVDRPCLHRIVYSIDGESERGRGLVQSCIETIRTFDHASNKATEFLQLCLVPQLLAPEGAIKGVITDEPGGVVEYDSDILTGGDEIKWREIPSMPREFENERALAMQQLGYLTNDNPVPSQVEAAKAIGVLAQKDILAWQDFLEDVAKALSGVGADCLSLAQQYYTEQRMIRFRGRTGWEPIADFRGADIRGQTDVRVQPGSLEAMTRPMIEQKIINAVNMFQGYFPPEIVLAALQSASFEKLNEGFEQDEEQAQYIVSQIRSGKFWEIPPRATLPGEEAPILHPDSEEPIIGPGGKPLMHERVPGWMPRPFDGLSVHRRVIETFMKSDEWRTLPQDAQEATGVYYDAILRLEAQKAARDAAQQNAVAEQLGAENAAKPQQPKQLPSAPALAGASEEAPSGSGE
ncbi:MAG TPA: hypothetical protein VF009_06930 [Solirubrobacterales bacterium]